MDTYFRNTVEEIREWSNKPIVLRAHPRYRERIHFPIADEQWYIDRDCEWQIAKKVQETYDSFDLEDQLKETNLTVSYSSNAGVNSIIQGIQRVEPGVCGHVDTLRSHPLRNSAPKKRDMNGHLISTIFPNHNYMGFMGIPVKKRDMNAIHPRFLKGEI